MDNLPSLYEIEDFYPYCFNKSDKLEGMEARHGTIFMEILLDEFKEDKKNG